MRNCITIFLKNGQNELSLILAQAGCRDVYPSLVHDCIILKLPVPFITCFTKL